MGWIQGCFEAQARWARAQDHAVYEGPQWGEKKFFMMLEKVDEQKEVITFFGAYSFN